MKSNFDKKKKDIEFWDSLTEYMFPKSEEKERKITQMFLRYGKGKAKYCWDKKA